MTLRQLFESIKNKQSIETKLNHLYIQKETLIKKVESFNQDVIKQQQDVERLEQGNLSSFFYQLIGKLDEKMDQEMKEVHEAKAKYQTAKHQLNELERDLAYYEQRYQEVLKDEQQYHQLFEEKLTAMRQTQPDIVQLEEAIANCRSIQKEANEAIQAGQTSLSLAKKVRKEIDSADGWATFDLFSDSFLTDLAKYDHLDKAERYIQQLQASLSHFQTELADVQLNGQIRIEIGEFERFADYFFDNIFTDWSVLNKITHSKGQINRTITEIDDVITHLENLVQTEKEKEIHLTSKFEEQVVNH